MLDKIKTVLTNKSMIKFVAAALFIGFSHYIIMQIYIHLCVGVGIWGFLTSFISLGSPVCQFINYIQYELSKHYITIWAAAAVSLVAWLVSKIS
tara:strand:+ start:6877 stop:7158 length:282 start_codon:yes stop_codon:yes gene_type:complete